ncbi:MAG TPA: cytochrome D1 domain-containing protein [Vicinamibacterales bacterium]|nr:cytochrome D1 domain-containing protein [Vicinamibacterales bacterium]
MIHAIFTVVLPALAIAAAHTAMPTSIAAQPPAAQAQAGATQGPPPAAAQLNFEVYRTQVEPLFLVKREGNARCVDCHAPGAGLLRLQVLPEGVYTWTEEQSRKNFEAVARFVVPGTPRASRLLRHPLARDAGGDAFHGGGKHWTSLDDPEYQTIAAWVSNTPRKPYTKTAVRIIQTNAAGDATDVIDPATNTVVGRIRDIIIPHGVTAAPDGRWLYITNEHLATVDVVNPITYRVDHRIKLSGRPNNISVTPDGRKVYAGIAQQPGAVDVIDTTTLTNVKTVPVTGSVHNVYVTPDGKFAVSGSVATGVISVIDTKTDEVAWTLKETSGVRPMTFEANPDGSTRRIFVQLSDYHGVAVVDWATRKEVARWEHAVVPGAETHSDGLQGAPAHGLGIPDGKHLWSTSKVNGYAYVYNLADLKEAGRVFVGQHPEWLTFTPDGKTAYIAAAGDNSVTVVDVATLKVVTHIPVGQVPKRNGTATMLVK